MCASLFYLGLAAVFGILNSFTDTGYIGTYALTHFNLLGFMSMMLFGIGYFLLPRLNRTVIRHPGWVPVHFWLANTSLIGMVLFRALQVSTGEGIYSLLFLLSALGQVVSIFIFISNIWATLVKPTVPQASRAVAVKTGEAQQPTWHRRKENHSRVTDRQVTNCLSPQRR